MYVCASTLYDDHSDANTHPKIGCYRNKASLTWTPPPPPFQLSKKYLCNWWVSTGKPTDEVKNETLLLVFIRRVETFGLAWGSRLLTASNTFKTTILRPTYPKIGLRSRLHQKCHQASFYSESNDGDREYAGLEKNNWNTTAECNCKRRRTSLWSPRSAAGEIMISRKRNAYARNCRTDYILTLQHLKLKEKLRLWVPTCLL